LILSPKTLTRFTVIIMYGYGTIISFTIKARHREA